MGDLLRLILAAVGSVFVLTGIVVFATIILVPLFLFLFVLFSA